MCPSRMTLVILVVGLSALLSFELAPANPVMLPVQRAGHTDRPERFSVRYQHVDVTIEDQAATTVIDQVFVNRNDFVVEGTYIFPIPESASITDFAMWMNDEKITGELLAAEEARSTYRQIVRSMKDPGLLEYAGRDMYRASVFPIPANGEVRVELSYHELLSYTGGLVTYRYPLNTARFHPKPVDEVSVTVSIESSIPIKSLMSPSHEIDPVVEEASARCGFEESGGIPDRDFFLYYTVSEEDVGLNLVTQRGDEGDGYFMLLISPGRLQDPNKVIPKDVVFVFDRSGSMQGDKIEQAKAALRFCLRHLNERDRFRLITFATSLRVLNGGLQTASPENVRKAIQFVDGMAANGSTNIDGALEEALATPASQRPQMIVFLTDGKPTTGVVTASKIVENAEIRNRTGLRLFTFGVGYHVNATLLDRLALDHRGVVDYVKPHESLEHTVTAFYSKVAKPVLSDIAVDFGGITVHDTYPYDLPDVFDGAQAVVFGRYEGAGPSDVRLTGNVDDREAEFVYAADFRADGGGNNLIAALWASRKIAYLTTEIRLHGNDPEVKEEIIRLAKAHGIVTEYTSYLVREDLRRQEMSQLDNRWGTRVEETLAESEASEPPRVMGGETISLSEVVVQESRPMIETESSATSTRRSMDADEVKVRPINTVQEAIATQPGVVLHEGEIHVRGGRSSEVKMYADGRAIVDTSARLARDRRATSGGPTSGVIQRVGEKVFFWNSVTDAWIDFDFEEEMEVTEVEFLSDEYFALLDRDPEIGKYLALGDSVTFVFNGEAFRVAVPEEDDGSGDVSPEDASEETEN